MGLRPIAPIIIVTMLIPAAVPFPRAAEHQKCDTLFGTQAETVVVCTTWNAQERITSIDRWISVTVDTTRTMVRNGIQREWYASGKPRLTTVFNDRGEKNGYQVRWNVEGFVLDSLLWENGGVVWSKKYYETGVLMIHDTRRTTMKRLDAVFYDPSGKECGRTVNGNGVVSCYSPNGKKSWQERYINGIVQNEEPPDE